MVVFYCRYDGKGLKIMSSNITKEQIELFEYILSLYEPYSFEVLDEMSFDCDKFDDNRIDATIAKKILIEQGIIK